MSQPGKKVRHSKTGDLIARCNRGDNEAWEEFYTTYSRMIRQVVMRCFPDGVGDTDEIVQEVFFQLFTALKSYDPDRSVEAYILEIARRVRISHYRKATAQKRGGRDSTHLPLDTHGSGHEMGFISVRSSDDDQEALLIEAEEGRLLRTALNKLSDACRELLKLRYDRNLSYKRIRDIVGMREGTLRVRVQRCLASLSKVYSGLSARESDKS